MTDQVIRSENASEHDGAFSLQGFCEQYGLSRPTVSREIKAGRLLAKKRGTRVLIERNEARRWFYALPRASAPHFAAPARGPEGAVAP